MEHRTRKYRGAVGLLLAAGVLLTGCSGEDGGGSKATSGQRRAGAPAPAYTGGAKEDAKGAEKNGDEADRLKESAPPDYLSTFALDVDTASYGYARRTLADGRLPGPQTVRPEEFVNSFRQGYHRPTGNGFSVSVDGARAGGEDEDWSLVRVGLATKASPTTAERPRPPSPSWSTSPAR